MGYYLYSNKLTRDMLGEGTCKLKYLKTLIDSTKALDVSVRDKFPISYFGDENDELRVKGVKALIEGFDTIDSEKMDIIARYDDLEYKGINDEKQIVLNIKHEDGNIEGHGIYDFSYDFLEEGFKISKFVDYCISNNYFEIIEKNLEWLLEINKDKEAQQYRLLMDHNGLWGIRGKTSNNFKNYDNSVVLYLSLLALHKYSIEKDKSYHVDYSYITDSSLYVFFEQDEPIHLPNIGDVYLGLAISNGEIRNLKFSAEMRYRIVNAEKNVSFSAIFSNPVFSIIHSMNVASIDNQLNKLFNLDELESNIIKFIKNLNSSENLSEDTVYYLITDLLKKLKDCSDISKKTTEEFKKLEIDFMIKGTLTLIDFLGKLTMISTDVDEKIFIERIFHKVINNLQSVKSNQ